MAWGSPSFVGFIAVLIYKLQTAYNGIFTIHSCSLYFNVENRTASSGWNFSQYVLRLWDECSVPPLLQSAQYSLPSESENPARKLLFHFHNNMAYKGYRNQLLQNVLFCKRAFKFNKNIVTLQYGFCWQFTHCSEQSYIQYE